MLVSFIYNLFSYTAQSYISRPCRQTIPYGHAACFCKKKIYQNTAISIYLHIIYGYVYSTTTEMNTCDKDSMASRARNSFYLALYQKGLQTPNLD